jgi:hypothetical protein
MRVKPDLDVGDSVPELVVTETTTIITRLEVPLAYEDEPPPLPPVARLGSLTDGDDEPPPLPPAPARGSRPYQVPNVTMLSRVIVPRMQPVPRRPESHTPPVELDEEYAALMRHLGNARVR